MKKLRNFLLKIHARLLVQDLYALEKRKGHIINGVPDAEEFEEMLQEYNRQRDYGVSHHTALAYAVRDTLVSYGRLRWEVNP